VDARREPARLARGDRGTFSGVFLSVDRGATWAPYSQGMDVLDTRRVVFHRQLARAVCTRGRTAAASTATTTSWPR